MGTFKIGLCTAKYGTAGQAWESMTAFETKGGVSGEVASELYDLINDESAEKQDSIVTAVNATVNFVCNKTNTALYKILSSASLQDEGSQLTPVDIGTKLSTIYKKFQFRPVGATDDKNDLIVEYGANIGPAPRTFKVGEEEMFEANIQVYKGTNGSIKIRKDILDV